MATTVLLADDHAVMRDGLRFFLEAQDNLEVVGDAGDGYEVVELAKGLHPDVILMDIMMPGQSGIEATRVIRNSCPQTRVVVLSMYMTLDQIHQALSAGVQGYLIKESAGKEVVTAIETVMVGERYLSSCIVKQITEAFLNSHRQIPSAGNLDLLSQREREVVQLVIDGNSSKAIAHTLFLSPNTVDTYRSRIMSKLGVHDLSSLVHKCIELGITPQQ